MDGKIARQSKSILGIDDSPELQSILHGAIRKAGFGYVAAHSGAEALEIIAARQPFSVILLDVQMPSTDGFEVCRQIRSMPKGRRVPIIFLTVHNTVGDLERSQSVGGNAFIVKPFDSKTLIRHLDYWSTRDATKLLTLSTAQSR